LICAKCKRLRPEHWGAWFNGTDVSDNPAHG